MIDIAELRKVYRSARGTVQALHGVTLEVPAGTLYTLLGPSGCGKTTTIRCLAGLERPDSGRISIGGEVVFRGQPPLFVPPERRGIGMVFQSYAIWPHMTVAQNVAYPLRARKVPRAEIPARVEEALRLVGLAGYGDRPAPHLSGGQQQRVALARALAARPSVLLLDEPLSNLDAKLREQMRREIRRLQRETGLTVVYVTHDQEEALAISDRIAVMHEGYLLEHGTPHELYQRPRHRFTADFLGHANFFPGRVQEVARAGEGTGARLHVETPLGPFLATAADGLTARPGQGVELFFRPENARLAPAREGPAGNGFTCTVREISFLGQAVDIFAQSGPHSFRLRAHPSAAPRPGDELAVTVEPASLLAVVGDRKAGEATGS